MNPKKLMQLALALLAAGCAALPAAQMVLPDTLAGQAPAPLTGLRAAREGQFQINGQSGRFERSASRLSLFDDALAFDRVGARYTLAATAQQPAVEASCRGRQTGSQIGIVAIATRPYEVLCDFSGGFVGRLVLNASKSATGQEQRSGRLQAGDTVLELRSVHRVQGSPLPLATPIGYVFTEQGRAVGALEINGTTPRLWGTAQPAVLQAAVALALLWDPAGR